ncbi:MAG TPA: hypothetical protein VFQ75_00435 [Candidatus Limnocylindrales bacterium]|nr:hypothetical protein [Candidatus Limnocylindrales bacterium]
MSSEPRAFAAIDRGTATVAASLVGRVGGHWRLLGATAAPAAVDTDAILERLRRRLADADPALAGTLGLAAHGALDALPRVACETAQPPEIAVLAATERVAGPLAAAAAGAGWRVHRVILDGAEILPAAAALANPRISAVLAGAGDPPGGDERSLLGELTALVTAATERRPDVVMVLAGGLATPGGRYEAAIRPDRPGATVLAPSPTAGDGAPLRDLLGTLRGAEPDGRASFGVALGTLAEVLGRRLEAVEIGQAAGMRVQAAPGPGGATVASAVVAEAALLPRGFGEAHLDAIAGWLTIPLDRLRVRDRLRELAVWPWGDAAGDGALIRLAAVRAAVVRLLAATPWMDAAPAPDVVIAAGGAWAVAPGPAIALGLADVVRRPGIRGLGHDHARLLAPLGTIDDPEERRRVIADLRDELLVPLGTVVMPAGLRGGKSVGRIAVRGSVGETELELVPGGLELVDLPPGERAVVELRFKDPVLLGPKARHFGAEVTGGLGGLLVDLRDVPLRLPDRPERRRDLLTAWQSALWAGLDA